VPDDSTRPVQHDARRPPRWLPRALVMCVVAVFVAIFAWHAMGALRGLLVNIVIAFFLSLVLEPFVVWLVRHGWRRGLAAITAIVGGIAVIAGVGALFGNLFVRQLIQLAGTIPDLYEKVRVFADDRLDIVIPETGDLLRQGFSQFGSDVAADALVIGTTLVGAIFAFLTVLLVTYYLLAAGPRFRGAVCRWLSPDHQTEVLRLWDITQTKVSGFINSRLALAALSSIATFVFLLILKTDYALPLAVFVGVVSQFVPTVGTYIGGALPVVVALTSQGVGQAVAVVVFIVAYQQLENMILAPKISARALEMNPAVSFVVVIAFGAVFGALGAFLALPVAATIQAVASTYFKRHELVESPMLHDPGEVGADAARTRAAGAGETLTDREGTSEADRDDDGGREPAGRS